MENSDKNSASGPHACGLGRKTASANGTKSSSNKQPNNVEQMLKATRFSCTKVEAGYPAAARAGFGKSGSFSGQTKFEELAVGGNNKTRRGIIKPSKEYVCFDDDNYFTNSDQNDPQLLILRVYQCHSRETTSKMEAVTRL